MSLYARDEGTRTSQDWKRVVHAQRKKWKQKWNWEWRKILKQFLFVDNWTSQPWGRRGSEAAQRYKHSSYSGRHRDLFGGEQPGGVQARPSHHTGEGLGTEKATDLEKAQIKSEAGGCLLSASDIMMLGLFPPSSSVTLLRLLSAAAFWIRCPTCVVARTSTWN